MARSELAVLISARSRRPLSPARGEPRRGARFSCDYRMVIFGFAPGSQEDQGEVAPCVSPYHPLYATAVLALTG
jgi:hypothetical protein